MIAPTPSTPEPGSSENAGPSTIGRARRWPALRSRAGHGRRSAAVRRRGLTVAGLLAAAVLLGGCNLPTFYSYRGVTKQEHDSYLLWSGTFIAAIVVGVITGGLILWAVFRYRRRSDTVPRQFQYHIPLEIFYTVVPIIIVLVLFFFTVKTENTVDAMPAHPAEKVEITAFQWGWKFDYLDQHRYVEGIRTEDPDPVGLDGRTCTASAPTADDCLGPALVMPVGETVNFTLISNDVIHSFYVPQFLFSRQALPGVHNHFSFTVNHTGIYRAQCNNICGLYHSQMFFHVVALPPAQFTAWVNGSQTLPDGQAGPLPTGSQSASTGVPGASSSSGSASGTYLPASTGPSTTSSGSATTTTSSGSTTSTTSSGSTTSTGTGA